MGQLYVYWSFLVIFSALFRKNLSIRTKTEAFLWVQTEVNFNRVWGLF